MLQIKILSLLSVMMLYFNSLNAAVYDSDILNTYSKLSPRFILMSTQKSKIDKEITICLTYNEIDEKVAQEFIEYSDLNYPQGIKNYDIKFLKSNYTNLEVCSEAQLLFLFETSDEFLNKAILFSQDNQIMTISYNDKFLEKGVDISLFVGRKVTPYLNLKSILQKGIYLENILLRISKIYKKPLKSSKQ